MNDTTTRPKMPVNTIELNNNNTTGDAFERIRSPSRTSISSASSTHSESSEDGDVANPSEESSKADSDAVRIYLFIKYK